MPTATATRSCACGLTLRPVMSRSDPDTHRFTACEHCDQPCTRKVCGRCKKAGVKS